MSKAQVAAALAYLRRHGSQRNVAGMARYGITSTKVFGTSGAHIKALARRLGRDHDLALALWATGWLEARALAAFVDEPARVTARQMDAWARAFDNWAVCDTACIHLFRYTPPPQAWGRIRAWSGRRAEYVRRAGFALIASVAVHQKGEPAAQFLAALRLVEEAASDERNYVKKAVSWALRTIGKQRDPALRRAAMATARRLLASQHRSARWIGRDAIADITAFTTRQRRKARTA